MDANRFHNPGYEFHGLICAVANCDFAYAMMAESKAHVDRLKNKDEDGLIGLTQLHLIGVDKSLATIRLAGKRYFED